VTAASQVLKARYPGAHEIILVPNPHPGDLQDTSEQICIQMSRLIPEVRVCPHLSPPGKGAAVRTGFFASRGQWIFFTDSDLPYDLDFFDHAAQKLQLGFHLVTGNRRLPESHFEIPVELLRIAYGRHRLGLGFNRVVRTVFPIESTDTQAGIKALSRQLAGEAFRRQVCPGFLFDLELFLTARGLGYAHCDLPVTLYLNSEKSTVRILKECLLVANWLTRLKIRYQQGAYGKLSDQAKRTHKKVLKRTLSVPGSLLTRIFLRLRWRLTPYSVMIAKLPPEGKILDLGCGHGLLSLAAALAAPGRQMVGIDHDEHRIAHAQKATQGVPNLSVQTGNILTPAAEHKTAHAVTLIDVLHYFPPSDQQQLLNQVHGILVSGGIALIREVDPSGGFFSQWNRFYEKLATSLGFTRSNSAQLYFRTPAQWKEFLQSFGFTVQVERCSSFLFADILYTCKKI